MKILKRALVTAVCVLTLPFLAASFASGSDSVVGSATTADGQRITVNVRSDGSTATGTVALNGKDGRSSYDAECLRITGTTAAIGGVDPDNGEPIWVVITDSTSTSDKVKYQKVDANCVPDWTGSTPVTGGNYRVTNG